MSKIFTGINICCNSFLLTSKQLIYTLDKWCVISKEQYVSYIYDQSKFTDNKSYIYKTARIQLKYCWSGVKYHKPKHKRMALLGSNQQLVQVHWLIWIKCISLVNSGNVSIFRGPEMWHTFMIRYLRFHSIFGGQINTVKKYIGWIYIYIFFYKK